MFSVFQIYCAQSLQISCICYSLWFAVHLHLFSQPHFACTGFAVDWWSMGVILYEMLLSITPFCSTTVEDLFEEITNGVAPLRIVMQCCEDTLSLPVCLLFVYDC